MSGPRPKFTADSMLGRLARWLRIFGYDTLYPQEAGDVNLIVISKKESRILLTRDIGITKRSDLPRVILIRSDMLESQLLELNMTLGIALAPELTRCPDCNGELETAATDDVKGSVPEGVLENNSDFFVCTKCEKVFWHGSHWDKILKTAAKIKKTDI